MIADWERSPAVAALGATLALACCAVAPPTGPSIVVVPPQGKDLGLFQQEDAQCRTYASAAIGTASASSQDLQARYDIAFAQCMYSRGNSVLGARIGAGYPAYAGDYLSSWWSPGFYPWYPGGPFISSAIVFRGRHHFFQAHHGYAGTVHPGALARAASAGNHS